MMRSEFNFVGASPKERRSPGRTHSLVSNITADANYPKG